MEAAKPLMPIVSFEKKPVEDRNASIDSGKRIMKDVDYITFIPHGSGGKTKVEYPYPEWKERIQTEVQQGDEYNPSRFPPEWFERINTAYGQWKKGEEMDFGGTALKNWPSISPAEFANCKAYEIHTVEQLAAANDDTVMHLGMGSRALVERAKKTVAMQNDGIGAIASQLTAREAELETERQETARLRQLLAEANNNAAMGLHQRQGEGEDAPVGSATVTGSAIAKPNVINGKKPNGDPASGDSGDAANSAGESVKTAEKPKTGAALP